MATRSRKGSAARGSRPSRAHHRGTPPEGGTPAADAGQERTSDRRVLDGVAEAFDHAMRLGSGHPLGRLTMLFALQALDWQSVALQLYQRALREGVFDAPPVVDDHLRKVARTLMSAYLDLVKSAPERRERLLAGQAELVQALSEAVENLRRHLGQTNS